jgi:DNA-binding NarL/FixJ family response regulator
METSDIRVLLADDHVLVRAGLRVLLQSLGGIQVVAEAGSGDEAIEATQRHQPDVVLMDIAMPGLNGLDAAVRILKQSPHIHLIILSMYTNEDYVRQALSVGVSGYLQKGADPAELELAIKAVMRNEVYLTPAVSKQLVQEYLHGGNKPVAVHELTPRQREILQLIAEGHSTKDMAQRLSLSVKTIESHRMEIMNRLGIHDVAGLVRYAIRIGLITTDS